jgi:hypothetical protein
MPNCPYTRSVPDNHAKFDQVIRSNKGLAGAQTKTEKRSALKAINEAQRLVEQEDGAPRQVSHGPDVNTTDTTAGKTYFSFRRILLDPTLADWERKAVLFHTN